MKLRVRRPPRHLCNPEIPRSSRSGKWPSTLRSLCTQQRRITAPEPQTSVTTRRSLRPPSITNSNVRSVGRAARHKAAEEAARDGRRLGGPFAQARHLPAALRADPRHHHRYIDPGRPCRRCGPPAGPARPNNRLRTDRRRIADSAAHHQDTTLVDIPRPPPRPARGPACPQTTASTSRPACVHPAGRWPPLIEGQDGDTAPRPASPPRWERNSRRRRSAAAAELGGRTAAAAAVTGKRTLNAAGSAAGAGPPGRWSRRGGRHQRGHQDDRHRGQSGREGAHGHLDRSRGQLPGVGGGDRRQRLPGGPRRAHGEEGRPRRRLRGRADSRGGGTSRGCGDQVRGVPSRADADRRKTR